MEEECFFAGEAVVIPQECIDCIGTVMDRIEKENKQLDDAVDVMRQEIIEMEVEMKATDKKITSTIRETRALSLPKVDLDAMLARYDKMLERIKKATVA